MQNAHNASLFHLCNKNNNLWLSVVVFVTVAITLIL